MGRFRSLVQNSNDLITVVGPASTIVYQSIASDRVLGRTSESLIGTRLEDLVHPEDRATFDLFVAGLKTAPGATLETECRIRTLVGVWREMHLIGANLLADSTVRGLVLTSRDVTERRVAERELAAIQADRAKLLDRTVEAAEQERKRLAADLHDGPVQHLAAMEVRLEALRDRLGTGTEHVSSSVERVQGSLREQVQALRSMMTELRPPALDERGLEAALRDHLAAVHRDSGLECTVESAVVGRLEPTYETLLYRVAQEGLTNAVKHAKAGRVVVRLRKDGDVVELEIADDGLGFDVAGVPQPSDGRHFGLIGMRERVELAGGTWSIQSAPGEGTLIRARLPLRAEAPSTAGAPVPIHRMELSSRGVS
jgi:PAS domain S-box-containing protein